jgi:hypothetical protein
VIVAAPGGCELAEVWEVSIPFGASGFGIHAARSAMPDQSATTCSGFMADGCAGS